MTPFPSPGSDLNNRAPTSLTTYPCPAGYNTDAGGHTFCYNACPYGYNTDSTGSLFCYASYATDPVSDPTPSTGSGPDVVYNSGAMRDAGARLLGLVVGALIVVKAVVMILFRRKGLSN